MKKTLIVIATMLLSSQSCFAQTKTEKTMPNPATSSAVQQQQKFKSLMTPADISAMISRQAANGAPESCTDEKMKVSPVPQNSPYNKGKFGQN